MPLIIRTVEWVFPAAQAFISLGANLERYIGFEPMLPTWKDGVLDR